MYWGGSAGEGLIVTPSADVIDEAHINGVPVLGTISYLLMNMVVKEDWVKKNACKDDNGQFPFAVKW